MPDKKREKYYLEALLRCGNMHALAAVEPCESPDFILNIGGRRVGIEITEYFHPPDGGDRPHQEVQSLKEQVMQLAEQLHAQAGGPALYVTAHFGIHGRIAKSTIRPIAESLAAAVLSQEAPPSVGAEPVRVPHHMLPREIVQAMLFCSVDGEDKLWSPDNGGWVAEITPAHVQQLIERKSRMVANARPKCDELWLLVAQNDWDGAPCELNEEAAAASYSFPFDRVMWLWPNGPRARDLVRAG